MTFNLFATSINKHLIIKLQFSTPRKSTNFIIIFKKINWKLGTKGYGFIIIFDLNLIFHNILNSYRILIAVITHSQLNLLFFDFFIKLLKIGIFNSTNCCKSWSFSTTLKFYFEIDYILPTLKPFSFLDTWTWMW